MSYGYWLETSKSANRNLVPSPNTTFIVPVLNSKPTSTQHIYQLLSNKLFLLCIHLFRSTNTVIECTTADA